MGKLAILLLLAAAGCDYTHTVDFNGTTTCWLIDPHPMGAIFGWERGTI